jgi:hypothetical protein
MKVVINACFGGFGLSREATIRLHKLGCKHIQAMKPKEYYGGRKGWEKDFKADKKRSFPPPIHKGKILLDKFRGNDQSRADPLLVRVVEEMGKDAFGQCAKLKIIDVPCENFEIEEYDGMESVSEPHMTWS